MRAGTITTKPMIGFPCVSLLSGFDPSALLFFGCEFASFFGKHHGDFSVKRKSKSTLGALHFRFFLIEMKRPLANGANQNFGKTTVHVDSFRLTCGKFVAAGNDFDPRGCTTASSAEGPSLCFASGDRSTNVHFSLKPLRGARSRATRASIFSNA